MDLRDHRRRRDGWKRLLTWGPRADVAVYEIETPRWTLDPITIALLSDFHPMKPWLTVHDVAGHVDEVNGMGPDMIVLGGDFTSASWTPGKHEPPEALADALVRLEAPLGVHAILGNHDFLDDELAPEVDYRTSLVSKALTGAGLHPLVNGSRRLTHGGKDFWVVGFDSQVAPQRYDNEALGRHDPEKAFAEVPAGAPAILLAHEPDYFVEGDPRAFLQISGHTHGGQANFFGWRPFTPSKYPQRYAYGRVQEAGRDLIVGAGLGYTHIPFRIAQPSEIVLIRVTGGEKAEE